MKFRDVASNLKIQGGDSPADFHLSKQGNPQVGRFECHFNQDPTSTGPFEVSCGTERHSMWAIHMDVEQCA